MLLVGHYRFNNPVAVERAQTGANACRRLLHPGITSALHTGMAPERRSELVAVRFTPAELTMLHELAEVDGLYQSDVIRLLIRRAHGTRLEPLPADRLRLRQRGVCGQRTHRQTTWAIASTTSHTIASIATKIG